MKNKFMDTAYPCHVPDRILDAPLLNFDISAIIEKIKGEETWKKGERNAITLLKNPNLRIVLIALHRQNEINFNRSGTFLSVQVVEGNVNFADKNQSLVLKKGSLLTLHEDIEHTFIAREDSVLLLTIVPATIGKISGSSSKPA